MPAPAPPPLPVRVLAWAPFVASAALVAALFDLGLREPAVGLFLAGLTLLPFLPRLLERRRMRRLMRSGDVDAVLAAWSRSVDRVPHPETMAPLITATALAANGFVERARRALELSRRGPAWEAAIEQRLVVATLIAVFDGEPERALESAGLLEGLPLPASPLLQGRVAGLRAAMGAFARAFAHRAPPEDAGTLETASRQNPLVHWALRYAAAVVRLDHGEPDRALRLLEGAPRWPGESVFAAFDDEIRSHAAGPPASRG